VSRGVADGAPLVKCQLLASALYEALRHELRKADATERSTLLAVTRQCHRGAAANISPVQALHELNQFAAEAIASSLALNCLPERSAIGHPANTLAAPHSSHVRHSFGDGGRASGVAAVNACLARSTVSAEQT
jgi:hypothetical protein